MQKKRYLEANCRNHRLICFKNKRLVWNAGEWLQNSGHRVEAQRGGSHFGPSAQIIWALAAGVL